MPPVLMPVMSLSASGTPIYRNRRPVVHVGIVTDCVVPLVPALTSAAVSVSSELIAPRRVWSPGVGVPPVGKPVIVISSPTVRVRVSVPLA